MIHEEHEVALLFLTASVAVRSPGKEKPQIQEPRFAAVYALGRCPFRKASFRFPEADLSASPRMRIVQLGSHSGQA